MALLLRIVYLYLESNLRRTTALSGAKLFSFFQFSRVGNYKFLKMPFDLYNAGATIGNFLERVLLNPSWKV